MPAAYAHINGVRVKVGDIDTDKLDINLPDGTVTINGLDVTVSGAAAPLINGILGAPVVSAGTPLLSLDLQFPKLYASGACSTPSSPGSDWTDHPTPTRRACACCTARTWSTCPTRTSRCSWGRRGALDERELAARVLANGRGGYCFELNTLLAALLRACGFS